MTASPFAAPHSASARLAARLVGLRRRRRQILPKGMDGEPAWAILLALHARGAGSGPSVSELAASLDLPFSSALRWVHTLSDRGILCLSSDSLRPNRLQLRLSALGAEYVVKCLQDFDPT